MDINITGNPGTGNTFQDIHIDHVDNFNPNAHTVNNYYYGEKQKVAPAAAKELQDEEKEVLKAAIMDYVSRLKPHVAKDWKNRYETIWQKVLALPEVEEQVYDPGRQKDTTFNRNLVAHIIYIMCNAKVFATQNATTLAVALEGDKDHPVRNQLGKFPDDSGITAKVKALLVE